MGFHSLLHVCSLIHVSLMCFLFFQIIGFVNNLFKSSDSSILLFPAESDCHCSLEVKTYLSSEILVSVLSQNSKENDVDCIHVHVMYGISFDIIMVLYSLSML